MWCLRAGTSPTFGTARKSGRVSSEAFERELSESLAAAEQKVAPVAAESDLNTVGRFVSDRKRSHAGAKNRHHRRCSRLNSIRNASGPSPSSRPTPSLQDRFARIPYVIDPPFLCLYVQGEYADLYTTLEGELTMVLAGKKGECIDLDPLTSCYYVPRAS
jgi:hypothetical protein